MIKSFNPIKSRRPWPPISISHLFQQGPFSSWPLLFLHLGCFCLDIIYNNNDRTVGVDDFRIKKILLHLLILIVVFRR